jgi:UDP-N-acetylmuramate--alanine ligase
VNSNQLAETIKKYHKNVLYGGDNRHTLTLLKKTARKEDVVLTMGAGDIYLVGEELLKKT